MDWELCMVRIKVRLTVYKKCQFIYYRIPSGNVQARTVPFGRLHTSLLATGLKQARSAIS